MTEAPTPPQAVERSLATEGLLAHVVVSKYVDHLPRLNQTWALDFMADVLYDRRHFRVLTIIDEGNREALAVEPWTSIPASRVIRVLDELIALHGRPAAIRVDKWPRAARAGLRRLVRGSWHCRALHPARQARSERLH